MGLIDFLKSGITTDTTNGMTRYIAGIPKSNPEVPRSALSTALANIDTHFAFYGFVEHFDQSLLLLAHAMGWGRPF